MADVSPLTWGQRLLFGVIALFLASVMVLAGYGNYRQYQREHPASPPAPVCVAPITATPPTREELRIEAVTRWADSLGVDPALALALSRRENKTAQDSAWSPTGCCVGVMQVYVKLHAGSYDELCGSDLLTLETNACYGVAILRDVLDDCDGSVHCALRRYGGFVTQDPTDYINDVLALKENT